MGAAKVESQIDISTQEGAGRRQTVAVAGSSRLARASGFGAAVGGRPDSGDIENDRPDDSPCSSSSVLRNAHGASSLSS
eukprot:9339821-Pyramimonas_sp.AAC.1